MKKLLTITPFIYILVFVLFFTNFTVSNGFTRYPESTKKIVAFGDSLTEGYLVDKNFSYPSILQRKLNSNGHNYRVFNMGVDGEVTNDSLNRFDKVLALNPDIVILELGINDSFAGEDTGDIYRNLDRMVRELRNNNVKVLLVGMEAIKGTDKKYSRSFKSIYVDLAEKYDIPLVPFMLDKVIGDNKYIHEDSIHPNENGYKVIVDNNIWPKLQVLL